MTQEEKNALDGKRIAAFDYGMKRVGFAVCDEFRIVVSSRGFLENSPNLMEAALEALRRERAGAAVVGVPLRADGSSTPLIESIGKFVAALRAQARIPVFEIDEAFSSRRATEILVASGARKKRRAQKGRTDAVAAAVILREFLQELE